MKISQNGSLRGADNLCQPAEIEEYDFSKLLERPRPLNMERQMSFDERSFSELSIGMSPRISSRNVDNPSRINDHFDFVFSPRISGLATPKAENGSEPHPMVTEAWDALRRSLVFFRGQRVGTIAALDNSDENLNYDQVIVLYMYLFLVYDEKLNLQYLCF